MGTVLPLVPERSFDSPPDHRKIEEGHRETESSEEHPRKLQDNPQRPPSTHSAPPFGSQKHCVRGANKRRENDGRSDGEDYKQAETVDVAPVHSRLPDCSDA